MIYAPSHYSHTARIAGVDALGDGDSEKATEQFEDVMWHLEDWIQINEYWTAVPLPTFVLRYEDITRDKQGSIDRLAGMLEFLMEDEAPSIEAVACADQVGGWAYNSTRKPDFYAWDHFSPGLRAAMLRDMGEQWCRYGYEEDFRKARGFGTGLVCASYRT